MGFPNPARASLGNVVSQEPINEDNMRNSKSLPNPAWVSISNLVSHKGFQHFGELERLFDRDFYMPSSCSDKKMYPSQTTILEGRTNLSECVFFCCYLLLLQHRIYVFIRTSSEAGKWQTKRRHIGMLSSSCDPNSDLPRLTRRHAIIVWGRQKHRHATGCFLTSTAACYHHLVISTSKSAGYHHATNGHRRVRSTDDTSTWHNLVCSTDTWSWCHRVFGMANKKLRNFAPTT